VKKSIFQLALLAGLLLAAPGCFLIGGGEVLADIKRISGVILPDRLRIISEFDNGEFVAGGKYWINKKDLQGFLKSHPFEPVHKKYHDGQLFNAFAGKDSIPFSQLSLLKCFSDCKPGDAWLFVVNPSTGELWIELQYPDFAGDGPPCGKSDTTRKVHGNLMPRPPNEEVISAAGTHYSHPNP